MAHAHRHLTPVLQCAPYRNTTERKRRITRHLGLNSAALTSFVSRASINTFAALSVKIDMDADKTNLKLQETVIQANAQTLQTTKIQLQT